MEDENNVINEDIPAESDSGSSGFRVRSAPRVSSGDVVNAAGNVAGTGMQATGKSMQAVGTGMQGAGKTTKLAGKGIDTAAGAVSAIPGVGTAIGVGMKGVGTATGAVGEAIDKAGKATKEVGKKIDKAGKAKKKKTKEKKSKETRNKILLLLGFFGGCSMIFFVGVIFFVILFVFFDFDSDASGGSSSGSIGNYSYNVNGKIVNNVKVELLECAGNTPAAGEDLIDFETYIVGVVYQETGNASYEALKAQAVAARSYALRRPDVMNNASGLGLRQENDYWVLSIRSCTNDQVFCNPDRGCWSNTVGGQTSNNDPGNWSNCTVYSGYDQSKPWSRGPLAADSNVRKAVKETEGQVLVDASGNIVYTPYNSTKQNSWNTMANNGSDYFEILMSSYGSLGASKIAIPKVSDYIDTEINNIDIEQLINLSQADAWKVLIGKSTNERAPYLSKEEMGKRMKTITVPYRTWEGEGNDPLLNTVKKEKKITVNAALADLWLAFFTDVYNEAPDFVIKSFDGCYNYRPVTNGSTLSGHAYGVACDINASTPGNRYKETSYSKQKWESLPNTREKYQVVYQGSKVMQIAHKYTLINGSDWSNPNDAMHFSFIVDYNRDKAQACRGKTIC